MLLANPKLKITCIDISDEYTLPAITVLNKYFNNAITFIHSDSLIALSKLDDKFDYFHIDGLHENDYVTKEFNLIKKLNNNKDNIIKILFDDQDCIIEFQNYILKNYKVINRICPNCLWNNVYFEIQL
jgi:hypothetical protein